MYSPSPNRFDKIVKVYRDNGFTFRCRPNHSTELANIGDTIKVGQVLCIIESMKIMNEIESEHNGIIKEIIVNNSDPVEFNQPIFIIEPT